MAIYVLSSLRGAPGVTTAAVGMTMNWPDERRFLAELTPHGGDLAAWYGINRQSLKDWSIEVVRGAKPESVLNYVYDLYDHKRTMATRGFENTILPTLAGITDIDRLETQEHVSTAVAEALSHFDGDVIADIGALAPAAKNQAALLARASMVVLVVTADLSNGRHLAERRKVYAHYAADVRLLVVGGGRYSPKEISELVELPVLGTLPRDEKVAGDAIVSASERSQRSSKLLEALAHAAATMKREGTPMRSEGTIGALLANPPVTAYTISVPPRRFSAAPADRPAPAASAGAAVPKSPSVPSIPRTPQARPSAEASPTSASADEAPQVSTSSTIPPSLAGLEVPSAESLTRLLDSADNTAESGSKDSFELEIEAFMRGQEDGQEGAQEDGR